MSECIACFISSNASCWTVSQVLSLSLMRRSHSGLVLVARCRMNFPKWFTIPRNLLASDGSLGASMLVMVLTFDGSGLTAFSLIMCPKYSTFLCEKVHLASFKVILASDKAS